MPFNWFFKSIGIGVVGSFIIGLLALVGFSIATFKVPNSTAFKITRVVGGENIDEIILRYIKFKKNKNKIYITKEEEVKNG